MMARTTDFHAMPLAARGAFARRQALRWRRIERMCHEEAMARTEEERAAIRAESLTMLPQGKDLLAVPLPDPAVADPDPDAPAASQQAGN